MLLKAPYVIPMTGKVVENGAVRTEGDRIAEVGQGVKATKADATIKLDDCILLPGLVNAHCHLDLSYLAGKFPPPTSFAGWVRQRIAEHPTATELQLANGLRAALQQCYRSGITCIGDHVGHLSILPFLLQMPLKGRAFLEIVGPTEERARAGAEATHGAIARHAKEVKRMSLSCTPHAPYSVHPTILCQMLETYALTHARTHAQAVLSIHCAESREERDCLAHHRGPLYELVTARGLPLPATCRSPIEYLEHHGGIPRNGLLIHCNDLDDQDIATIRAAEATIVHCPQSHRYFGFDPFPFARVRAAGIPVVLGTDSLASAPTLNLFTEMQLMKEKAPTLTAAELCAMVTTDAARALGMEAICGAIAPGLAADLIAVRIAESASDPYENVLCNKEVPFVVMDGRIVRNVLKGEHGSHPCG